MKSFLKTWVIVSCIGFSQLILAQADTVSIDNVVQRSYKIGVKHAPPFVYIGEGEAIRGLSIEFWEMVNRQAGVSFEYIVYDDLTSMLDAVSSGRVDMSINPVTVTEQRMEHLDFSLPFFISETAMVQKTSSTWGTFLDNVFSLDFFRAVIGLLAVLLVFGLLIWLAERRKNKSQFSEGIRGLGDGFWWSAVTMTTVGYGDKSPVTPLGRFIGLVWMFAAIILISSLTAGIASALTVQRLGSEINTIRDLKKFSVVTVQKSSSSELLDLYQVPHHTVENIDHALDLVKTNGAEVLVYDRPILQYHIQNNDRFESLSISSKALKTDYYSFVFPKNYDFKKTLDPLIVRQLKSSEWNFALENQSR
jgi:ABC-type amino acid transport substrate-binding protein